MNPVQISLIVFTLLRLGGQAWAGHKQSQLVASQLDAWLRYKASHPEDVVTSQEIMEYIAKADQATDEFIEAMVAYADATGQTVGNIPPKVEDVSSSGLTGAPVDLGSLLPEIPEDELDTQFEFEPEEGEEDLTNPE